LHTHFQRMTIVMIKMKSILSFDSALWLYISNDNNLIWCEYCENILYNLIFITKFNDTSILITIISWDYMNLSVANEYVGDVRIPNQVIKYNHIFCRRISQSDWSPNITCSRRDRAEKLLILALSNNHSLTHSILC
jgi:hypothetical protein